MATFFPLPLTLDLSSNYVNRASTATGTDFDNASPLHGQVLALVHAAGMTANSLAIGIQS